MSLRAIAMKEAKVGRCMELEEFLKQYPEKDGWKECNFTIREDDIGVFRIYIILQSHNQQVSYDFPLTDSVIIKEYLKKTGELTRVYLSYVRTLTNKIDDAGSILLA